MKSVMSHNFSQIPTTNIERSVFDRSHGYKTTLDSGYLVPFYLDEFLPSDSFSVKANLFLRLSTPICPIMDNIFCDVFFFAVPSRLIWKHWQNMNGEQINPSDSTDYSVPTITTSSSSDVVAGSLADYLGIPLGISNLEFSSLPFRAYHLVWDQWFRDENLQNSAMSLDSDFGDGPDSLSRFNVLRRRGKRHDYFTSSLPWPQKGVGVELPLGSTAPVVGTGALGLKVGSNEGNMYGTLYSTSVEPNVIGIGNYGVSTTNTVPVEVSDDKDKSNLVCDLSNATAATINSLRQAFQIQRMYERDARGGTRYTEILRSHFGVVSPDARLQRTEYLGGGSFPVMISQVPQTSSTDNTSPQGNLAAFGTCSVNCGFTKSFVEHGYILGLVNIRADLNYQQGLNRLWSRKTRFDFYWPSLAHLGEQAVLNKEIYAQGASVTDSDGNVIDNQPFGYQERYAEYRYHPSMITGQLRSTYSATLDYWHLAQKFDSLPALNSTFIEDNPPIARCLALSTYPQFIMDSFISCKCARPMPVFGVPGLMDHF